MKAIAFLLFSLCAAAQLAPVKAVVKTHHWQYNVTYAFPVDVKTGDRLEIVENCNFVAMPCLLSVAAHKDNHNEYFTFHGETFSNTNQEQVFEYRAKKTETLEIYLNPSFICSPWCEGNTTLIHFSALQ